MMILTEMDRITHNTDCRSITVSVEGKEYRLTESRGKLVITCSDGCLAVFPRYSNVIEVEDLG